MSARGGARARRIYDERAADDGYRVLVDRIWPRGVAKADAALDEWCKEIAPSTELRKWYGHDPEKFDRFRDRYHGELRGAEASEALERLRKRAARERVTLLTATKDIDISAATVLADTLRADGG